MKKISLILASALALVAFASCNKTPGAPEEPSKALNLVVSIDNGTRATGITSNDPTTEARVNSLQVFVFNSGSLDGYGSSNTKTATVSCTSGEREIYAVVNAPDLSAVTTKEALLATVSTLANEVSNFQMIGSTTETLQYDGTVQIHVDRLAARVVLRGIRNAIENSTLASQFKIISVYLTNATGDVNYGKSADYMPTLWYNRRGYEVDHNLGSFTYDAVNANVAAGATNSDVHFFYTMPNAFPGKVGLETGETAFTPRAVRLLIRVEIAGTLYNYPILLPALQSNKSYEINLVNITKNGNKDDGRHDPGDPGDTDEEDPVTGFEQTFEIIVNDWDVVLVENGEITI